MNAEKRMEGTPISLAGLRPLIVAIDWHGDVAPALADGFRQLEADPVVVYFMAQQRKGVRRRLEGELLSTKRFGVHLRMQQQKRSIETIRTALKRHHPDVCVCLSPDVLAAPSVEDIIGSGPTSWWFGDDPQAFERRALAEPPPVLGLLEGATTNVFVAHPAWAIGPLSEASYLPYGATNPSDFPAIATESRSVEFPYVVVGSPRRERAEILRELFTVLSPAIHIWGWGRRGRLGLSSLARPFRNALRGARPLTRVELEGVYRSAGVVINLQDHQMIGAWNPQTFDVLGIGTPQVVWNRSPIAFLDNPPQIADDVRLLAELCRAQVESPDSSIAVAGHAEVHGRHLWRHRAADLVRSVTST